MNSEPVLVPKERNRSAGLHLLWTAPIALAASYIPAALANLIMCGQSGFFCYHDG